MARSVAHEASTPTVSYLKASEVIIYNAQQLQVSVWARCDTHTHLASRFAFLHKTITFPSVILATVLTGGTFFTSESKSQAMNILLGVLGVLTTMLVTFSTHFDFTGLAESHKHTAFALRRFDRRLEQFVQRLTLRGTHAKQQQQQQQQHRGDGGGDGGEIGAATMTSTVTEADDLVDEVDAFLGGANGANAGAGGSGTGVHQMEEEGTIRRGLNGYAVYTALLEELLEVWDQIGDHYNSILENSPDLYGIFTGFHLLPAFATCRRDEDFTFPVLPLPASSDNNGDSEGDGNKGKKVQHVDTVRKPLNSPGRCYDFNYVKAKRFMRNKTSNEIRLVNNVDTWAEKIERNHSATTPFNRSNYQHVAVELPRVNSGEPA